MGPSGPAAPPSGERTAGTGRRLGVDVGSVRVGVAVSDPGGILATPVVSLRRDVRGGSDLAELMTLVADYDVVEVVVGLPRTLAGRQGSSAVAATTYAEDLGRRIAPIPVRLYDERLTTVSATRSLRDSGMKGRRQRAVVDQAAAVVILQGWLDSGRTTA